MADTPSTAAAAIAPAADAAHQAVAPAATDAAAQTADALNQIATTPGAEHLAHLSPLALFLQADGIVKTVIILLLIASVWAWAIIVDKTIRLRRVQGRADGFLASLRKGHSLADLGETLKGYAKDPFTSIYNAIVDEYKRSREAGLDTTEANKESLKERVHRVATLAANIELERLQRGLQGLATIGSVSPFVGLFGTVWGIMNSFQGIAASNNTSLAVVAPGIAEALFATALGLFAAIPAVVAYNRISGDIGRYAKRLTTFTGLSEVELSRQLSAGRVTDGRFAA
jgi:biopolymer transport protein TolQ